MSAVENKKLGTLGLENFVYTEYKMQDITLIRKITYLLILITVVDIIQMSNSI